MPFAALFIFVHAVVNDPPLRIYHLAEARAPKKKKFNVTKVPAKKNVSGLIRTGDEAIKRREH